MKAKTLLQSLTRKAILIISALILTRPMEAQVVLSSTASCSVGITCGPGNGCVNALNVSDGSISSFATVNTTAGNNCTVGLIAGFPSTRPANTWAGVLVSATSLAPLLNNVTLRVTNLTSGQSQLATGAGITFQVLSNPNLGYVEFQSTIPYDQIELFLSSSPPSPQSINAHVGFSGGLTAVVFALPVDLVAFNVSQVDKSALLTWRTASESNTDRFEIEVSTDSYTFTKIGQVSASGNSSTFLDYSYTDLNISRYNSRTIFYRLKQLDRDGKYVYSPIRLLKLNNATSEIRVYPVPFNDVLSFDLPASMKGVASISLFDQNGRLTYRRKEDITNHQTGLIISDLGRLPAGIYLLKVETPQEIRSIRVIKQ